MKKYLFIFLLITSIISGCASNLNSIQTAEYEALKHNNVLVQEKDPAIGALLGILPGFGSFYTREPGYGIANLLLWPLSVLWDPVNGYEGSKFINYTITKQQLRKKMKTEISVLDDQLATGEIDIKQYTLKKRSIEDKYTYE